MKAATCEIAEISARLKAAREALRLTQGQLAQAVGGSKPGIQDNEAGKSMPGGKIICGLVRLGVNANWLLTGEGPMLLADLTPKPAPAPVPVKINIEALAASLDAMRKLAPASESPEATCRKAAQFYQYMLDMGLITPDGLGEGHLQKAG